MRKILAAVVVSGLVLAGCGGSGPEPSGSPHASSCATSKLNLVTQGTLTIGTDNPAYPPYFAGGHAKGSEWKLNDPNDGKGFESAIAYAVADQLGFSKKDVKWVVVPFVQTYTPGSKKYDFAIEQIAYSPKRAKAVAFSDSYYEESQVLVAVKGTPITKAKSISDLKDFRLAAPIGTTSYDVITNVVKPNKEPGAYNTLSDTVAAINAHAVDGIVVDYPTALYIADPYVQEVKNSVAVGQFPVTGKPKHWGMTFVNGNSLVDCVNRALGKMRSDGTLQTITTRWLSKQTNVGEIPLFSAS
jgi:polar amino acid transport system substrate-binding protein